MPTADVAVIGAGLAGLATAVRLAQDGARVAVIAQGYGTLHWTGGPIDVGAARGASTPADAVRLLAGDPGHPYAFLGEEVGPAISWFAGLAAEAGLPHTGALDGPFGALPTGIGGTRPVAIVPAAQAAALAPWEPDERLLVIGPAGYKDFWPRAIAASLSRPEVWAGRSRPERVEPIVVELPGFTARHNINALRFSDGFDDPAWRAAAIDTIGRAVERAGPGRSRVALPAFLGNRDHAAAFAALVERLECPVMELPLVPPGIPGMRVYGVFRNALRALGGRILVGEPIARVETAGRRVVAVTNTAATRELVTRVGALVLATGGIPGGGLVGDPGGRLLDTVLDLPVEGPPIDRWMTGNPLDPGGMPIASAGIRTDAELRPVDPAAPDAGPLFDNVRVVGALLAGQNWLRDRSGDGVALASAWRAAASLGGTGAPTGAREPLHVTGGAR